jgi:hypothetical protein
MVQRLLKKMASRCIGLTSIHTQNAIQPIGAVRHDRDTITGDSEAFDQNLIPNVAAVGDVMVRLPNHPFDFGNGPLKVFTKLGKRHWADAHNKVGDTDHPSSSDGIEFRPEGSWRVPTVNIIACPNQSLDTADFSIVDEG